MLIERIEGKWIEAFADVFSLCRVGHGDAVAILSETQSRPVLVQLSELALHRLGARAFHVVLPTPPQRHAIPLRSTGTSLAIDGLQPVVSALAASTMVVDCTVEGMLHAPELKTILQGGARLMMISNEHPELLERTKPTPQLRERVVKGLAVLEAARQMRVTSDAGTDLMVDLQGAPARAAPGFVDQPGKVGYWPAGLVLCFPARGRVQGRVVLAPGDVNLTFKRYVETPVALTIENDMVTKIEGSGVDAELLRSYYSAWNDPEAYAVSHVGWGMNLGARWDALAMYDRSQINGTEQRAFEGNFLFSTGANETAERFTDCHFDYPMRNCSIELDGQRIIDHGRLVDPRLV